MSIAIAVFLVGVGVFLLWLGHKAWKDLMKSVSQVSGGPEPMVEPRPTPLRPVRADALVYLYGHRFVRLPKSGRAVSPRLQAFAPLTGEGLDAGDWTTKMLFVLWAEQHEVGAIEFQVIERTPTLMPPFPHKNWEMQVRRVEELFSSPLGACMAVAFDMVEKRRDREEEGTEAVAFPAEPQWFPLDLIIEKMLQVVRAETSFWQRESVYGDLRNYVADALVAEGFLQEVGANTWIQHLRRRRLEPDREAIQELETSAEDLLDRLETIRRRYGSAEFLADDEREVSYTHLNTPAALIQVNGNVQDLLWADALGISIYETLVGLRQLEPTGDGGL